MHIVSNFHAVAPHAVLFSWHSHWSSVMKLPVYAGTHIYDMWQYPHEKSPNGFNSNCTFVFCYWKSKLNLNLTEFNTRCQVLSHVTNHKVNLNILDTRTSYLLTRNIEHISS